MDSIIKEAIENKKQDKKQKEKTEAGKKEFQQEKEEIIEKILTVLDSLPADDLEFAADVLAPEFDHDFEARGLALEEERGPLPDAKVNKSRYPKKKRRPWTSIGRYFLRDKHRKVWGLTILAFLGVTFWMSLDYIFPENVHVIYQTIDDIKSKDVKTRTATVGDLLSELKEEGYKIDDEDSVHPVLEAPIKDKMYVKVLRSTPKTAKIKGKNQTINMIAGTVNANLSFNGISFDENDNIKPALFSKVDEDTTIVVDEVHYKTKTKRETVEAESIVELDPSLASGVQTRTAGNDGDGYFKYRYKYVNGKKVKTERSLKKWVVKPKPNALRLGTSRTGNTGKYKIIRTFTANCTAYSAKPGAHGAAGTPVHLGTCAVDPRFISYGSILWVEGYGFAVANDCGSAVKNNVVDLFMPTMGECLRWGRRNMLAYQLVPVN